MHVVRLIFFANIPRKNTGSALPLLNLLDILTVHLFSTRFKNLFFSGVKVYHSIYFETPSIMPVKYIATLIDMHPNKANKPHVRTNTHGASRLFLFKAIDLWKCLPQYLKELNVYTFSLSIKHYLSFEQYLK